MKQVTMRKVIQTLCQDFTKSSMHRAERVPSKTPFDAEEKRKGNERVIPLATHRIHQKK
jgi:hypothetical protein